MKFKTNVFLLLAVIFSLNSCSYFLYQNKKATGDEESEHEMEAVTVIADKEGEKPSEYRAEETKYFDLIHTELKLKFDYKKKYAFGKATLTLKPHYYKTDSLVLNARGFDINKVAIVNSKDTLSLDYKYDSLILTIKLKKEYSRNDTVKIFVDYVSKPDELKQRRKTWVMKDDKGLYFVDADSDNPQIWTQGETQSNSCWFPTLDSPNQKTTQEIYLTVEKEYTTLSNGVLLASLLNDDGTRTDYWKQDKPHAPYLVMIAIGKFEKIEDHWRDTNVDVYVEASQVEKAKELFKKTYKMIEFYSQILDVEYPWDKYAQVVVKQFVSGAMENTSATVFGSYVLNFSNEESRRYYETVVAHELSHHWFGDLVTCESWANLPLNESFATYFEYLWVEKEYGREEADKHRDDDIGNYFFESIFKDVNLIRFEYEHRDDMFDAHSYQKGSTILHMLRYEVGDEAFFDALELYFKKYKFGTAEIHDLRLAYEEVTGRDMNWFFNQWFLSKGYPVFDIEKEYNTEKKKLKLKITQKQNSDMPVYKINTNIDIYIDSTVIRKKITIDEKKETYEIKLEKEPRLIIFDADDALLCKKEEHKTKEEYLVQLEKVTLYRQKSEAFNYLKQFKGDKELNLVLMKLINSSTDFWRIKAINMIEPKKKNEKNQLKKVLNNIIANDKSKEVVRAAKRKLEKL